MRRDVDTLAVTARVGDAKGVEALIFGGDELIFLDGDQFETLTQPRMIVTLTKEQQDLLRPMAR